MTSAPSVRWTDKKTLLALLDERVRTTSTAAATHKTGQGWVDVTWAEVQACRAAKPGTNIKVNGYDRRYTRQTVALSFLVQRPKNEPGYRLERQEANDRVVRYTRSGRVLDWVEVGQCARCGHGVDREFLREYVEVAGTVLCRVTT